MDSIKVLLNNLIQGNIIFDLNKGKLDKESFKLVVVKETSHIAEENPAEETNFQKGGDGNTFFNFFYAFFCPGTMITHAESILIQIYSVDWTDVYDTHNSEQRTEPISH